MRDGWTNITNRPLLNILVISPKGSFRKAINTIGKEKTSIYIPLHIMDAIEGVVIMLPKL
jgi:hypothetical protein